MRPAAAITLLLLLHCVVASATLAVPASGQLSPATSRSAGFVNSSGEGARAGTATVATNSAFLPVDEATRRRLQPAIKERYFRYGKPLRYQRHRVVRIDEALLASHHVRGWRAYEEGAQPEPIVIPLFDDEAIEMIVDYRSETIYGSQHFIGVVLRDDDPTASAWFRFRASGEVEASIRTKEASYRIALAGERPYYVVFEYAPLDADW